MESRLALSDLKCKREILLQSLEGCLKRSKETHKECAWHINTSELSLKKEGQNQSDEVNSSSGAEQELMGITGTKEESPVLDYALFGNPQPRPSLKFWFIITEWLTLIFPREGACMDVNAGWCPASWLLWIKWKCTDFLSSVALCIDTGQRKEDFFLNFSGHMTLMLVECVWWANHSALRQTSLVWGFSALTVYLFTKVFQLFGMMTSSLQLAQSQHQYTYKTVIPAGRKPPSHEDSGRIWKVKQLPIYISWCLSMRSRVILPGIRKILSSKWQFRPRKPNQT